MALHYGTDDFSGPAQLARTLGRERAKDTTLDYKEGRVPGRDDDPVRRYAERRGLNPLRPDSEIVVRTPAADREVETPVPRRSRFAGLRLDAHRSPERPASAPSFSPAPARVPTERERQRAQLDRPVADFAQAWSDVDRRGTLTPSVGSVLDAD